MTDARNVLERGIAAHRNGRRDEARSLYEVVLRHEPRNVDARRYLGRLELECGGYPAAILHLEAALRLAPEHPGIRAELSRALAAEGRLEEAGRMLEALLAEVGESGDLRFNLAMIRLQTDDVPAATAALKQILESEPGHPEAALTLSRLRLREGRNDEATRLLEGVLEVEPGRQEALLALATLKSEQGDDGGARALLERAIEAGHGGQPEAHIRLSRLLEAGGDLAGALKIAEAGTAACPGHDIAWRHLGDLHKRLGNLAEAVSAFERAHGVLRMPGTGYGLDRPEIRRTNRAKLRHDLDQLRYLRDRGVDVPGLATLVGEHEQLATGLPSTLAEGEVVGLPASVIVRAGGHYNRCMHRAEAPEIEGGALNPELDPAAISADYRERAPGITWIDGFLRPEALHELRRYLLESTIWYDADHPNGYVGCYLHDGFTCPLILQIARELPALLPEIFGDRPLLQLWAYHYDSRLSGIDMHADFAAVNVNFWLTPTEAMLDRESGGMVVWDKEAPREWTYRDYNTAEPETKRRIDDFLAAEGARQIRIPHRQNRVVIFNSDLFHKTDDIRFKDGFENRRINVTMLYGHRDRE